MYNYIKYRILNINYTVTVFGSSIPLENDEEYQIAYQLGHLLGKANINVCNGGNLGIMDAVSKGAKEQGVEVIGVTVSSFVQNPTKYLTKEIKCNTLFDRIQKLIDYGDAYIILQGGTGTLLELASVWELMNKNMMKKKPIACHSKYWFDIIHIINQQLRKEGKESDLVKSFFDIEECANYIIRELINKDNKI